MVAGDFSVKISEFLQFREASAKDILLYQIMGPSPRPISRMEMIDWVGQAQHFFLKTIAEDQAVACDEDLSGKTICVAWACMLLGIPWIRVPKGLSESEREKIVDREGIGKWIGSAMDVPGAYPSTDIMTLFKERGDLPICLDKKSVQEPLIDYAWSDGALKRRSYTLAQLSTSDFLWEGNGEPLRTGTRVWLSSGLGRIEVFLYAWHTLLRSNTLFLSHGERMTPETYKKMNPDVTVLSSRMMSHLKSQVIEAILGGNQSFLKLMEGEALTKNEVHFGLTWLRYYVYIKPQLRAFLGAGKKWIYFSPTPDLQFEKMVKVSGGKAYVC